MEGRRDGQREILDSLYYDVIKVMGDSLHKEILASTEPFVSQQRKLLRN